MSFVACFTWFAVGAAVAQEANRAQASADDAWIALNSTYEVMRVACREKVKGVLNSAEYKNAVRADDEKLAAALLADAALAPLGPGTQAMLAARQFDGEHRVRFYVWALLYAGAVNAIADDAAKQIMSGHSRSRQLVDLVERGDVVLDALGASAGSVFMGRIAKDTPDGVIRSYSLYWQAKATLGQADASESDKVAAIKAIAALRDNAADGTPLALRIDAPKFEAEHLKVGVTVPQLAGTADDGKPIDLAEYRGKVVVVCFFDPAQAQGQIAVANLLSLVEKHATQPFAVFGVNGDGRVGELLDFEMEEWGRGWRSLRCGVKGAYGDIPTRWNVHAWPTIYVLDQQGVIRFARIPIGQVDVAVEHLLKR